MRIRYSGSAVGSADSDRSPYISSASHCSSWVYTVTLYFVGAGRPQVDKDGNQE